MININIINMSNSKDNKLDQYITRIKESNNSNNKLLNYKKAVNRLDELKIDYNNLCTALKINTKNKEKSKDKTTMEKIINELNKINMELDDESNDMHTIIDNYIQYKLLLENLETENENFKNEILKVEQSKGKISISKINPDEIL